MILSIDDKNAMLQGLADRLNTGTDTILTIYIDESSTTVFDMPNPIEASITDGVITFDLPAKVMATISGVPTTAKLTNSAGSDITFNVGSEIVLDKPEIYAGGYVSLSSLTIAI